MRFTALCLSVTAVCLNATAAQAADTSSGADELKQGYILKLKGDCAEAIPHFLASYRADPKPKALLNLADCEQQTGELIAARSYAEQGRDLAVQQKDAELVDVADQQLASIDKRLPHLTLRLSAGAPTGASISRDGVAVDGASLGTPVGLNPGRHRIVVTAPGHTFRTFDVAVAEGEHQDVEVQPGAPTDTHPAPTAPAPTIAEPSEAAASDSGWSPRQALTYGAFGLAGVGIVIGVAVGIAAGSKHGTLDQECPAGKCPSRSAQGDIDSFHSLRTWSTVGYIVGIAGLAGGVALWLTAPKPAPGSTSAQLWVGPASAGVAGAF